MTLILASLQPGPSVSLAVLLFPFFPYLNFWLGVSEVRRGNRANRLQGVRPGRNLLVNRVDEKKERKIWDWTVDRGKALPPPPREYLSQVGSTASSLWTKTILT